MAGGESAARVADERAGSCPVSRGADVRAVLGGEEYAVAQYGRGYAELKARSGHDFANIAFALAYLPLAHDGERHQYLRERASRHLQARNEVLKGTRQRLASLAAGVFAQGGRIDLVRDLADPIVAGMVRDLSDVEVEMSPSLIFDPATSLRKRRMLDGEIGRIVAQLQKHDPQADNDAIGIKLAFAILANDATKGMILANLAKIVSANIGKRLSGIDWPSQPAETGIRFIERIATCPVQHDGAVLPAGTVMRADFDALSRDGDAASLFGVGRHVCLGRGFFWAFWRDLMAALGGLPGRVTSVDTGPSSNRVFAIPDYVYVEVEN